MEQKRNNHLFLLLVLLFFYHDIIIFIRFGSLFQSVGQSSPLLKSRKRESYFAPFHSRSSYSGVYLLRSDRRFIRLSINPPPAATHQFSQKMSKIFLSFFQYTSFWSTILYSNFVVFASQSLDWTDDLLICFYPFFAINYLLLYRS